MSLAEEPDSVAKQPATNYVPLYATYLRSGNVGRITALKDTAEPMPMPQVKILLVDDDKHDLLLTLRSLEKQNCEVVSASCVTEALREIAAQPFDVLLTDLNMPDAGDGLTIVTAMRHTQPQALTVVWSGGPDVQKAMNNIPLQADEVLQKPFDVQDLPGLIQKRILASKASARPAKESVASILERDHENLIQRWLARVEKVQELAACPIAAKERTAYLPELMKSITDRLGSSREKESIEIPCTAAVEHGQCRYEQGYTAPMIVQESRLLQVSIFETIERNLSIVDFTAVMPDIMIIADEVDFQLKQAIGGFLTMERGGAALGSA